ncbi:MAG: hypothetical protein H0V01_09155 [Bacteroidetes bacterium]|nr:hypothetical protein [Bacteroidota bacterium]HET6243093.1 hypothetical protein [Bacteroidia bacterium]
MKKKLIKLAYNSVKKSVSEALVMLNDRYQKNNESNLVSISREDLANIVGQPQNQLSEPFLTLKMTN